MTDGDDDAPVPSEGNTPQDAASDEPVAGESTTPTGKAGIDQSETLRSVIGSRGEATRDIAEGESPMSGERTQEVPLSQDPPSESEED